MTVYVSRQLDTILPPLSLEISPSRCNKIMKFCTLLFLLRITLNHNLQLACILLHPLLITKVFFLTKVVSGEVDHRFNWESGRKSSRYHRASIFTGYVTRVHTVTPNATGFSRKSQAGKNFKITIRRRRCEWIEQEEI